MTLSIPREEELQSSDWIKKTAHGVPARRTIAVGALLACGLLVTGCGMARPRTVSQTSPTAEPMSSDEAMALRDWSPSVAYYATGTVQAYPTRWPNEGAETDIQPLNAFVEPVIFLAQTAMLPVQLVLNPPAHRFVNYGGPTADPTYNAMPPLLPEPPLNHPAVEPLPAPERVPRKQVRHEAYRPFGGMREWWNRTFSPPPSARRTQRVTTPRMNKPLREERPIPTQPASEPATTQGATEPSTSPATESVPTTTPTTTQPEQATQPNR